MRALPLSLSPSLFLSLRASPSLWPSFPSLHNLSPPPPTNSLSLSQPVASLLTILQLHRAGTRTRFRLPVRPRRRRGADPKPDTANSPRAYEAMKANLPRCPLAVFDFSFFPRPPTAGCPDPRYSVWLSTRSPLPAPGHGGCFLACRRDVKFWEKARQIIPRLHALLPVSYTHLTLPTKLSV